MANITEYHTRWWWSVLVNFFYFYSLKLHNHRWTQVVKIPKKVDLCQWRIVITELCWDVLCWLDQISINLLPQYGVHHFTNKPQMGRRPTTVTKILWQGECIQPTPPQAPQALRANGTSWTFPMFWGNCLLQLGSSWGWGLDHLVKHPILSKRGPDKGISHGRVVMV